MKRGDQWVSPGLPDCMRLSKELEKMSQWPSPTLRDCDLIGLGWSLDTEFYKSSPGNCTVLPGLRRSSVFIMQSLTDSGKEFGL